MRSLSYKDIIADRTDKSIGAIADVLSQNHCEIVEFVEHYKMTYPLLNISFVIRIVGNDFTFQIY